MSNKNRFIKEYTKAILGGYAAVFAGAGLSRGAGYVDWKDLLRPLAEEIGLNIDEERDLVSVAQFYRNEMAGRYSINSRIIEAFTSDTMANENIDILTRLPIHTYWTTNYDRLLEEGFRKNNRRVEVKIDKNQLATIQPGRDSVLYKMHGDVEHPAEAVITKDDYESYDHNRPLFRTILEGDLISKTFLFIGFSFEDPNLDYILGRIHTFLGENEGEHYWFLRRAKKDKCMNDDEFKYLERKQALQEKDLKRYGIQTIFVDEYDEITDILRVIEQKVRMRNVFISGSAEEYGASWDKASAEQLASALSKKLVAEGYRITSGFGLGIGSSVINGALEEVYESKYKHTDEYLCLRPFPQGIMDEVRKKELYTKYRKDMIEQVGISIFMFGNKKVDDKIVDANGCLQEYEIAKEAGNIIIPIGSTGYVAKAILNEIKQDINNYTYLKEKISILEETTDIDKIVETVLNIIGSIE